MGEITVTVERYKISNGNQSIFLQIYDKNRIIIKPGDNRDSFMFCASKPSVVKSVAELLLKAVEVAYESGIESKAQTS